MTAEPLPRYPVDLDDALTSAECVLEDAFPDPERREAVLWHSAARALVGDRVPHDVMARWFGTDNAFTEDALPCFVGAAEAGLLAGHTLGDAYERRLGNRSKTRRRDAGVYFTPHDLASFVVGEVLAPLLSEAKTPDEVFALSICDPAAGAGAFALPVLERLAIRATELARGGLSLTDARRQAAQQCIHLVDADPLTVAVLRSVVIAYVDDPSLDVASIERNIRVGDALLARVDEPLGEATTGAIAWTTEFPSVFAQGGFAAVVGNPPWGSVRPVAREWFGQRDATYLQHQGAEFSSKMNAASDKDVDEWSTYAARRKTYARALRVEGGFQAQGSGDADLYRYFVERAAQLLKPGGRLGLVIPSAFQRAEGAAPLRRALFESGTAEMMFDFRNSRRVFDIHPMFRFMVLVWQHGILDGPQRTLFGLESVEAARSSATRAIDLDRTYLRRVSGDRLSVPEVRSVEEKDLFAKLHGIHPPLGVRDEPHWNVEFVRELDMTNDSDAFIDVARARSDGAEEREDGTWEHPTLGSLLPLYEGRMVHQFDASAKRYLGGQGRSAKWSPLPPSEKVLAPHFLVSEDVACERGLDLRSRVGFCDVTGHANERTVLSAMIPARAACGNKVPTCRFDRDDERLTWLWLALANSFVVDWLIRRRVSTTLNFFIWEQIPVPRLDPQSGLGCELVALARTLDDPAHQPWRSDALEVRASARAQIDAAVCDAYGVEVDDFALILADFPLLDRSGAGGIRSTITRDLALFTLADRRGLPDLRLSEVGFAADAGSDVVADRVADAIAAGGLAYVPGELRLHLERGQ